MELCDSGLPTGNGEDRPSAEGTEDKWIQAQNDSFKEKRGSPQGELHGIRLEVGGGDRALLIKVVADYVSVEEQLTGNYP